MSSTEEFSKRLAGLSQTKRGLLQKWKRGELTTDPGAQTIPRRRVQGPVPLSFAQQRVWFIDQLIPDSPAYNLSNAMLLVGALNSAVFQESLNEIRRRHESLRTAFPIVEGRVSQVIAPVHSLSCPTTDLCYLPEGEREAVAWQLAHEEARQPFDLADGPLIRARLLRLAADRHMFLLVVHHTICDGWSLGVFQRELGMLYEAYLKGMSSPLPELPIQYADFAIWQREWLQGEVLQSQLSYWKKQLAGASAVLQLPTDRPRSAVQTFRGGSLRFELPRPLSQALKALSQREGVTLFTTLLAAFKTLLYLYGGQEDILVGVPVANRRHIETEGLIGFFANTLVLRTTLSRQSHFRDTLAQVHRTMLEAYAYQDLPLEYLVEELHLERDMSHNPLFQVMFNFGNVPHPDMELPGLRLSFAPISAGTSMFDLWLSMSESREGSIKGILEYNSDIFDESTATRLLRHLQVLLAGIAADPSATLAELPLLTPAEREQILVEWNATQQPYPSEQSISQAFEEQVTLTPDAIATVFEQHQLSYQELNRQANRLAHELRGRGVGPDVLVGVCLERSLELVIALLAIFKAGGAYVPLDPHYPQQRLIFLLEDTDVAVLLTQQELKGTLPRLEVPVLSLDTDWFKGVPERSDNPACVIQPDHLAYVIYTSGSTGQPKGAMNRQRSIYNRLRWMQDVYQLRQDDRVLQKTPISFDVSVWEFFWPLLNGACLVVARPEGHRDGQYLVETIAEQQITTVHFVPSLLQVLLEEDRLQQCTVLRRVICSGEALSWPSQQRWHARMQAALSNLYGPTEAAVDVTWWICQREDNRVVVPIGKPIANTQIYLLDERLNPVPVGVAGELYIGGVSLGRGYLKQAALTAERFIPHPFSAQAGERLYKTGDRARYLPDGALQFLGRTDDQVKLHGFRIELGEIEAALQLRPEVQDVFVLAHEDIPGDKRLVAYVVMRKEDQLANPVQGQTFKGQYVGVLREHLKRLLPEYMIPAVLIPLDALPLTANGKVDRWALPEPGLMRSALQEEFVAPGTPLEECLVELWKEVLGRDRVGITENFFEIGGDSIRSIQIISRARAAGLHLTPRHFFQHQTIASLAAVAEVIEPLIDQPGVAELQPLQSKGGSASDTPLVQVDWQRLSQMLEVDPAQIEDVYPLSPMQQSMLFQRLQADDPGLYWLCAMSLRKKTQTNLPAFARAWQRVVDQHPVIRTVFVWEGLEEPLQVVLKHAQLCVEQHDWRGLAPGEQEKLAEEYIQALLRRGVQLSCAPQLHIAIAQVTDEDYYQFFGFNYMLLDGWSSTLRGRDFAAFYEALCRGQDLQLEAPRLYRDHIAWLQQQDLAKAEAFWHQALKGFTVSTPLVGQIDRQKPRAGDPFVKEILPLTAATTLALQSLARKQQLTLATLFNSAWALVVSRAGGQEDVVFGHLSSGRSPALAGSEYMVGFFNNILPLRIRVSPEARLSDWLKYVQSQMVELREYEYSPLLQIKEWIGMSPAAPLFESYVVFENFPGYGYKGVGEKTLRDFGVQFSDNRRSFVPTEYPLRIEFWPFQQLTMMVSSYQCYCPTSMAFQLLQQLKAILEGIAVNSTQTLGELLERVYFRG